MATPEEVLEQVRATIGQESTPQPSRYPVEYEPIRRYCHMTGCDDPLHLDEEFAATTEKGGVIAPPFYIRNMSGAGPFPPVRRAPAAQTAPSPMQAANMSFINLNTEFEVLGVVRPGDQITRSDRLGDAYIKSVRMDAKAIWTVRETVYRNQNGEIVLLERNTGANFRRPEAIEAAGE